MRYQPEHKVEIHQKIVKDASRRVRTEGLTGAAVSAVMRDTGLGARVRTSIFGRGAIWANSAALCRKGKI